VPVISFVSFTPSSILNAVLVFNFTDANGNQNIGQQQGDTTYDLYVRYYWKNYKGNFVPYYFRQSGVDSTSLSDSSIYPYHLPYLDINIKTAALNGQIIVNMNAWRPVYWLTTVPVGLWQDSLNHFRLEFWMYDRKGHKSNVVTTPQFDTNF
jgi:hypothetical protein